MDTTIKEILRKLEPVYPGRDKFIVSYGLVDKLYGIILQIEDKNKREHVWDIIHLIRLLSDIELLNREDNEISKQSANWKIEDYVATYKKVFGHNIDKEKPQAEDVPELKKIDPSKCELKQDTFF